MYDVEIHKGPRVIIKEVKELQDAINYLTSFIEDKRVSVGFVTNVNTLQLEATLRKGTVVTNEE
jgi:altronate dehydratase